MDATEVDLSGSDLDKVSSVDRPIVIIINMTIEKLIYNCLVV